MHIHAQAHPPIKQCWHWESLCSNSIRWRKGNGIFWMVKAHYANNGFSDQISTGSSDRNMWLQWPRSPHGSSPHENLIVTCFWVFFYDGNKRGRWSGLEEGDHPGLWMRRIRYVKDDPGWYIWWIRGVKNDETGGAIPCSWETLFSTDWDTKWPATGKCAGSADCGAGGEEVVMQSG